MIEQESFLLEDEISNTVPLTLQRFRLLAAQPEVLTYRHYRGSRSIFWEENDERIRSLFSPDEVDSTIILTLRTDSDPEQVQQSVRSKMEFAVTKSQKLLGIHQRPSLVRELSENYVDHRLLKAYQGTAAELSFHVCEHTDNVLITAKGMPNSLKDFVLGALLQELENDFNVEELSLDEIIPMRSDMRDEPPFSDRKTYEAVISEYGQVPNQPLVTSSANTPNDTFLRESWYHTSATAGIGTLKLWENSEFDKDFPHIKVAVLDSGVDKDHEDLQQAIIGHDKSLCKDLQFCTGFNAERITSDVSDVAGHGTGVAGLIGAVVNNRRGILGPTTNVQLIPIRILDREANGTLATVLRGINFANKVGAQIINNSYGGKGSAQTFSPVLKAIKKLPHIIFVFAAGNEATNNDKDPTYPASFVLPNIISVASTDSHGKLSSFSCFGRKTVAIAAPGEGIITTYPKSKYKRVDGTSFATPLVVGTLALLAQKGVPQDKLVEVLLNGSRRNFALKGRVRAERQLDIPSALAYARAKNIIPSPAPANIKQPQKQLHPCEEEVDPCAAINGVCKPLEDNFECKCTEPEHLWTGLDREKIGTCRRLVNPTFGPCKDNGPCGDWGLCVVQRGLGSFSVHCRCLPGYPADAQNECVRGHSIH